MRGIGGNLWIAEGADQAVELYTSLFEDGRIGDRLNYTEAGREHHGREPGSTMTIEFSLAGRGFVALEGGPVYRLNPSISLAVSCPSPEEVDRLWAALLPGGEVLMDLDEYPWAPRYGWVQDRFGLSWQLGHFGEGAGPEKTVAPSLLFTGQVYGRAREAMEHYTSVFGGSSIDEVVPNPEGDVESVLWASFTLAGETFTAMESGLDHRFGFDEGFSFLVECESQEEVERYWAALGEGGSPGRCGWLRDRFGVAWQVVPVALKEMLRDGDPDQVRRITDSFMAMDMLELDRLEEAYRG